MTIKLSRQQNDMLTDMRTGTIYYHSPITDYRPYTKNNYGITGDFANGSTLNSLEKLKLITKNKINFAIYKYEVTELGKSIEL